MSNVRQANAQKNGRLDLPYTYFTREKFADKASHARRAFLSRRPCFALKPDDLIRLNGS